MQLVKFARKRFTRQIRDMRKSDVIVSIRRAYESPGTQDGCRVLVDRLWPRGLKKSDARIDQWWKECAPSTQLRKWFDHDPVKWTRFRQRYTEELEKNCEEVARLVERAGNGPITLVYAAKDDQHNHAIVLKEFMENRNLAAKVR